MKYIWNVADCLDEIKALMQVLKDHNITDGDEREKYFILLMKRLGKKPLGATELNKEELANEYASHGKSVLSIDSENGKPKYKIFEPKKDKEI